MKKNSAFIFLLGSLALTQAHGAASPAANDQKCKEPIEVNADSADVDYKSNTTSWNNVTISQCDIRVQAKRASATGLNSASTRWTFEGDVRIDVEKRGTLRSKQAVVDVQNDQIAKATITGSPAEFEQRGDASNITTRGHAGEVVYEVGAGTVRLKDDAWISHGTTDMKGSCFLYDIRDEKVQAGTQSCAGGNQRVRIRITPGKKPVIEETQKGSAGSPPNGTTGSSPPTPPRTP
jgi:lipopolysaccharide transport protein LptA